MEVLFNKQKISHSARSQPSNKQNKIDAPLLQHKGLSTIDFVIYGFFIATIMVTTMAMHKKLLEISIKQTNEFQSTWEEYEKKYN